VRFSTSNLRDYSPTRKIDGMSRVSAPESRETWDPGPYRYPGSDLPGIPRQRKSPRAEQHGGCGHSIGARGSTRDLPEMGFRAGPASSTPRCGSALTGAQPFAVASYPSWSPLAFIRFRNLQSFHGLPTAPTPNRYSTCYRERAPHTSGHSNASCIWWRVPDTDCSGVLSQKTCRLWRAIRFHHEEPQVRHGMPSKLPAPSTVSQKLLASDWATEASNVYKIVSLGTSGCHINRPINTDACGTTFIRPFRRPPALPSPPAPGDGPRRGV